MPNKVSGGASFGCYVKLFTTGMGRRIYCLSFQQVLDITKWSVLSQIFVSTTLDLSKISICLFVLRVVDKARKGIAKSIWLLLFCIALTHMLQVTLFLVQCRPLSALWSTKVKGRCFSTEIVYTIAYLNYGKRKSYLALSTSNLFTFQRHRMLHGLGVHRNRNIYHPTTQNETTNKNCLVRPHKSWGFVSYANLVILFSF